LAVDSFEWEIPLLVYYTTITNKDDTCSGTYAWDFVGKGDDSVEQFEYAKVLCNDGDILAILAKPPGGCSDDYQIYYETRRAE
jgi:hypothetical protein